MTSKHNDRFHEDERPTSADARYSDRSGLAMGFGERSWVGPSSYDRAPYPGPRYGEDSRAQPQHVGRHDYKYSRVGGDARGAGVYTHEGEGEGYRDHAAPVGDLRYRRVAVEHNLDHRPAYEQMANHRGEGPKGYQRSDERIKEEVCGALAEDFRVDASDIEVQVESGEVTLSGTVEDRHQKRWAVECIETLRGVRDVQNYLRIHSNESK